MFYFLKRVLLRRLKSSFFPDADFRQVFSTSRSRNRRTARIIRILLLEIYYS
jgi:hypothetical protein